VVYWCAVCIAAFFWYLQFYSLPPAASNLQFNTLSMANEQKEFTKVQAAVLAAFAADAYGLGYEWVYDVSQIKQPLAQGLQDAGSQYLKGKKAGDFDMYGDHMLATLRSLAEKKSFDAQDFGQKLQAVFNDNYVGWKTSVLKHVLGELAKGTPPDHVGSSDHDDSNAFGQNTPLFLAYSDKEVFLAGARQHTHFCFRSPLSLKFADFWAHVTWAVKEGHSPLEAIQEVVQQQPFSGDKHLTELVHKGLASKDRDTIQIVKEFGQGCSSNSGCPIAIHLLAKYGDNFQKAIEASSAAGGDSTGRNLIVGALIALHQGSAALPPYVKDMKAYDEIVRLLQSF